METYKVPSHIDPDKIFLVNHSELEGRFDPIYYCSDLTKFNIGKYKSVTINSIAISLKSGVGAGKQDQTDEERGIIQIRPTNIDENGFLKYDKNIYIPDNASLESVEINDVLFNNTNSQELVGKTAILKENRELYYSNHITKIRVHQTRILADYLWIILNIYQKNKIFYSICTNWNNQSGVGLELLKSLKIPLPPLEIQQQIVDFYEKAFQQKQQKEAEAQALLESIDTYLLTELGITLPEKDNSLQSHIFTTQFSKVVGRLDPFYYQLYFKISYEEILNSKYKISNLKNVITFIESGSRPSGGVSNFESGILSIGGEHVNNNCEIEVRKPKYIPLEYHQKNINTKTQKLDVLLVKDGATTGKTGIIENINFIDQNINEHVFLIRANHLINSHYLAYLMHSNIIQIQIKRGITGATVTGLTKNVVKNLKIPLPPIEKQNEIAGHIQQLRSRAKQLQEEATQVLEQAKQEVEKMILGE